MRVAFLAPDIDLSGFTGDVWHVKDLAIALGRAGCSVDLFVAESAGWIPGGSVRVRRIPGGSFLSAATALARMYRKDLPDIIYERRFSPKLSAALARLIGRPYLVEINGLVDDEMAMQGHVDPAPKLVRAFKASLRGRMLRHSVGLVAVTEGLRDALIQQYRLPPERITVIPNGVDLRLFTPDSKDAARRMLGIGAAERLLIFVGNLVVWQGVATLLLALPIVLQHIDSAKLVVVGDGPERPVLETLSASLEIEGKVRFAGRVERNLVPVWLHASDVAIMPCTLRSHLKSGSSQLKFREYLACGVPVVATNVPGAGPVLEREGVGLGCRGDDPQDLARAIVQLLDSPENLGAMGRRARAFAERELSWDRSAAALVGLFQRMTGKLQPDR